MSLSQLEAKSWLCSKELQPGWFTWTYLHTPRVLLQLPCATQQEDFCATYGMGSYSFRAGSFTATLEISHSGSQCVPALSIWVGNQAQTLGPSSQKLHVISFHAAKKIKFKNISGKKPQTNKQQQEQNPNPTGLCQLAQYLFWLVQKFSLLKLRFNSLFILVFIYSVPSFPWLYQDVLAAPLFTCF